MNQTKSIKVKSSKMKTFQNKINIYLIRAFFLLLTLWIGTMDLSATHIVGGNVYYKKIGPNKYEITLELRRDCFLGSAEAVFDDPASVGIFSANGALQFSLGTNGQLLMPYDESDTLNNIIMSDCGFEGEQVCVEEFKYVKEVTLPFRTGGYILAYQRCCRNGSLANLTDPLETGATYSIRIPETALLDDNSSPVFNQWPPVYICANEAISFDQGATDIDGDSLVYRLCTPQDGASMMFPKPQPPSSPPYDKVQWLAPFSLDNLLGGSPLQIDPNTGVLTGTPNAVGQFLVGVCIDEYRDGVYLGSVNRDFQYNVRVCSDPPTAEFEAPTSNCDGLTVQFTNTSTSATQFFWAFNYPDTINNTSTEENPEFTFPSSGSFDVLLRIVRGTDQCNDEIIKTINVFDADFDVDFATNLDACLLDDTITYTFTDQSMIDVAGTTFQSFNWTITQNTNVQNFTGNPLTVDLGSGDFTVILEVMASNGCIGMVEKVIDFNDFVLQPDFNVEISGCNDADMISIKLNDLTDENNPDYTIVDSQWEVTYNGAGSPLLVSGDGVVVDIPRTNYNVSLIVTADNGCVGSIDRDYSITDFIPSVDFEYGLTGCNGSNNPLIQFVELSNDTVLFSNVKSYNWTFNSNTAEGDTVVYESVNEDSIIATLSIEFADGCFATTSQVLYLDEIRPQVNYNWMATECPTDGLVTIQLTFDSSQIYGESYDMISWEAGVISNLENLTGETVTIIVPKDSIVIVNLSTNFDNGCSDTINTSFYPGDFAQIEFVGDTLVLCPFETANIVTNPNSNLTYNWSPITGLDLTDPSNPVVSIGEDVIYYVTVSDGLCSVEDSIRVDVLEQIELDITGDDFTCLGDVMLTVTGSVGPGIYEWSTDPTFVSILATGPILTTTFDGDSQTYYVRFNGEVCDAEGDSFTVTNQSLSLDFISPYEACNLDTFEFPIINDIPGHDITIQWDDDVHIIDGANTMRPTIIILAEDDAPFELYFNATNQFGCEVRDTILITLAENPIVDFTFNVVDCDNYEVCFDVVGEYNGFPIWDLGDTTTTDDEFVMKEVCYTYPGPGVYEVTLSNIAINCPFETVIKTIELRDSVPLFGNSDSIEVCINSNLDILLPENAEGLNFSWCDALGNTVSTNDTLSIFVIEDVFYVLKVLDENGCDFNDTIYVSAFDFEYELILPPVFCAGEPVETSIDVSGDLDYIYEWTPLGCIVSGANTANPIISVTETKTVIVQVTHPTLGCVLIDSFEVTPTELMIEADADPDAEIYLGESVDIFVIDQMEGDTYEWDNGVNTGTQTVMPEETTTYTVTVTDEDGCTGVASITIVVIQPNCEEDVFLPNAFTPNGDEINSILYVRSNFVEDMILIIYNRWNEEVFRSTDITFGWDGTFKGEALAPDAYAYYLRATCVDGFTIERSGNINLIR